MLLFLVIVAVFSQEDVWVTNFFGNGDCIGASPFILRMSNFTCTSQTCTKNPSGSTIISCVPPPLGNYAQLKKYRDDKPGACDTYWSDGFALIDSCIDFRMMGMGYVMVTCDGKNLIQANYTNEYCEKKDQVLSHYVQDECVLDFLHDNDVFVKFGRCGV